MIKQTTMRVILTLAIFKGWKVHQIDVNNALLNRDHSENIYMNQPPSFKQGRDLLYCLKNALYGLKQALKTWFSKLSCFYLTWVFNLLNLALLYL